MRLTLATGLLAALIFAPSIGRADLVISGATAPSALTSAETPAPADLPPDTPADAHIKGTDAERPPDRSVPVFLIAKGFGHGVPLAFAVRQIVPAAVKVSYGPGARPEATVSWSGGKGWNWVLAEAVRPLGLHLVMRHMAVEIRK